MVFVSYAGWYIFSLLTVQNAVSKGFMYPFRPILPLLTLQITTLIAIPNI